MHPDDTAPCFHAHMGIWAINPMWLASVLQALKLGLWPVQPQAAIVARDREKLYGQTQDGVAVIRIQGQMTKTPSKFGGTSAILTRMALRQALASEDISSIMFTIDSPGGQVAGINDLAVAIRQAGEKKPVAAYIEDLGASAAYWLASQTQRITANPTAEIGSIGVFAVLQDLSGMAEREGVQVRVVSTGPYKGLGVSGTPVTQELIDDVQSHVNQIGAFFFRAVQQGRRLSEQRLQAVTDGRVWLAQEAQQHGLIDGVESFEEALVATAKMRPRRRMAAEGRREQLLSMREALGCQAQ